MEALYVGLFGVAGVFARYGVGKLYAMCNIGTFPGATFTVNLIGAFLISVVNILSSEAKLIPADLKTGMTVGFLGGFTTFSSLCYETVTLLDGGSTVLGVAYVVCSPILGCLLAWAGLEGSRKLFVNPSAVYTAPASN